MEDPQSEENRRLHAVVRGVVQGVGFRATTYDEARRLGLAGWVRNRVDGSVEVLAEGPTPKLKLFLAYLHRGPLGARVTGVVEDWSEEQGAPLPFQFKRTE
ncbi:MAG TPA: acylphosphatase [Polyangia bacterium]